MVNEHNQSASFVAFPHTPKNNWFRLSGKVKRPKPMALIMPIACFMCRNDANNNNKLHIIKRFKIFVTSIAQSQSRSLGQIQIHRQAGSVAGRPLAGACAPLTSRNRPSWPDTTTWSRLGDCTYKKINAIKSKIALQRVLWVITLVIHQK